MRVVLGPGESVSGGEGVRGGGGLQQRHDLLENDNKVISGATRCFLLWRFLIAGGAFEQERAAKKKKPGAGDGFSRGLEHMYVGVCQCSIFFWL